MGQPLRFSLTQALRVSNKLKRMVTVCAELFTEVHVRLLVTEVHSNLTSETESGLIEAVHSFKFCEML